MCVSLKSIGQHIKILERLQHISDALTDGRPAFPYPPLLFAGAEDKNCCSFRLNKLDTLTQTEKAVPRPTLSEGNAIKNIYIDAGDDDDDAE